ncbi:leucyl aminopeptidase family protein [Paenibacillus silvisoli]|uniref:leucyl aminopeptidase family protein n=1 Tax=Paenibacillus silvisoli TaxID=3110539 RepID=UPI0028038CD1|nr:leucyl aminopeptidase family protein [Paenibacillus silvisoli]
MGCDVMFQAGLAKANQKTLIIPVSTEGLADLAKSRTRFDGGALLPHMALRHAVTWFYGYAGEPDILLVGLGEAAKVQPLFIREAAGSAGRSVLQNGRTDAFVSFEALPSAGRSGGCDPEDVSAWVEGWLLGTYAFDKYKAKQAETNSMRVHLDCGDGPEWQEAVRLGRIRAEGTLWARDLANEPPNYLRPRDLAERAAARFAGTQAAVNVYEGEQLERMGFAGLAAVGKGSAYPPVMIEIRYCTDAAKPLTALIGKGITFDTGGISLKRDHDISDMRMDMAGAAGVLGALDILVRGGAPANVAVLVPAAENTPSDRSLLPGEVIRYANGVTVQVGNTDSEGRLILADTLIYARQIGAVEAVDMATLTYYVVGALGSKVAGILGDHELAQALRSAGEPFGERVWQLPLVDDYEAYLDSDYADTSNISKVGEAGTITAALFLRKFVHPDLRWAHIDMNGPKASSSAKGELAAGATGYGARMLAAYLTGSPRQGES